MDGLGRAESEVQLKLDTCELKAEAYLGEAYLGTKPTCDEVLCIILHV